jgi:hypothetical protein
MTATAKAATDPRGGSNDSRSVRVSRRSAHRAYGGNGASLRDARENVRRGPTHPVRFPLRPREPGERASTAPDDGRGAAQSATAPNFGSVAEAAANLPPAHAWAAGIYSDDERLEHCHDAAVSLWFETGQLDPWRVAKRVRNQANRGAERQRLVRSIPLEIDDATGLVDTTVADSLNEKPGRARPRRRARRRSVWTAISEQEEQAAVHTALGQLPANHQQMLWAMAGDKTQAQIATERGVSQVAVSRLWNRARDGFIPAYFDALGLPLPAEPTRPRRRRRVS